MGGNRDTEMERDRDTMRAMAREIQDQIQGDRERKLEKDLQREKKDTGWTP